MRLLSLLRQPYPVLEPPAAQGRRALLIGLFVGLFLIVFEPFGLSQWITPYKTLKILGFGLIAGGLTVVNFTLWPRLFPAAFAEDRWTVGRAMLFINATVLVIAVGNYLYLFWLMDRRLTPGGLLWMVGVTFAIGLFPVAGTVVATYIRRLHKYQRQAARLVLPSPAPQAAAAREEPAPPPLPEPGNLTLTAENEKDRLTLAPGDLLYVESSDNYCMVVYRRADGALSRTLLRSSLTRLEGQLPATGRLVRCHRSFVVNLDHVERVSGNAQGYRLHLAGGDLQVPVARKYNDSLVAGLKRG